MASVKLSVIIPAYNARNILRPKRLTKKLLIDTVGVGGLCRVLRCIA